MRLDVGSWKSDVSRFTFDGVTCTDPLKASERDPWRLARPAAAVRSCCETTAVLNHFTGKTDAGEPGRGSSTAHTSR